MTHTRRIHTYIILVITACLSMAAAQNVSAIDGTPSWSIVRVNDVGAGYYTSTPSLAFDHYGVAGLSWSRISSSSGDSEVYYSQPTALGLWSHTLLDDQAGVIRTALTYDRSERPVVVWGNTSSNLSGCYNLGSSLNVATNFGSSRPCLSLQFNTAGTLQGLYTTTSSQFRRISWTGSAFSTAALFTPDDAGSIYDADTVTDLTGRQHIIACEHPASGDERVLLASETGAGDWVYDRSIAAAVVRSVDIAVNPISGRVGFAYSTYDSNTGESKLTYSEFNGISMETTELFSSIDNSFEDLSLAFDPIDGRPAIAYERFSIAPFGYAVRLAYLDDSHSWQDSLIDDSVSTAAPNGLPRKPSLAFDDYGTSWPAVAYVDEDGGINLAYDPPGAAPEPGMAGLMLLALSTLRWRRRRLRTC